MVIGLIKYQIIEGLQRPIMNKRMFISVDLPMILLNTLDRIYTSYRLFF